MNEIISALERVRERAYLEVKRLKACPVSSDYLDYRAVIEMAYDHLKDTKLLFEHARKLKNQLEADRRSPKGDSDAPD